MSVLITLGESITRSMKPGYIPVVQYVNDVPNV